MRMEAEHPLAVLPWVGKRQGRACLLRQLLSVTITPKPSTPFTLDEPEPDSEQGLCSESLPSYSLIAKSRFPTHCSVTFSSICSL